MTKIAMNSIAANPFAATVYGSHQTYHVTADDRIAAVRHFTTREQCRAALVLPGLQKTVARAVRSRLRQLERDSGARSA